MPDADLREHFGRWLLRYHKKMLGDVALARTPGYLQVLQPCAEWCIQQAYLGKLDTHYHTISVHGVLYGFRDPESGHFRSEYQLWHELHRILPAVDAAHPSQLNRRVGEAS